MRKYVLFIILASVSIASAYTDMPGGNVSGTWTVDGSPYRVLGDITVHADSALSIEPGVDVNFQYYSLTVNGLLEAVGTETDSIQFSTEESMGWLT